MRTLIAMNSKRNNPTARATSTERRREEIGRKAAAMNRHWSADERQVRSELAEHLQRRLFATIVDANERLLSVG